jgi:hypothetical protein
LTTRTLYPLEFSFKDVATDQPTLFLGDLEQTFALDIDNAGAVDLTLPGGVGCLLLRFRPGVLTDIGRIALAPEDVANWGLTSTLASPHEADAGTVAVTLSPKADVFMPAGGRTTRVRLVGVKADDRRTARESMLRLEYDVRFPDGVFRGVRHHRIAVLQMAPSALFDSVKKLEEDTAALRDREWPDLTGLGKVDGLRTDVDELKTRVELIERIDGEEADVSEALLRRLQAPVAIDLLNTELRIDGSPNDLTLRVQAVDPLPLNVASARFVVRIDAWAGNAPWGLSGRDALSGITADEPPNWQRSVRVADDGSFVEITVTPKTGTEVMRNGSTFDLKLHGLVCFPEPGLGIVQVSYEGLGEARQRGTVRLRAWRTSFVSNRHRLIVQAYDSTHQIRLRANRNNDDPDNVLELRGAGDVFVSPDYQQRPGDLDKATRFTTNGAVVFPNKVTVKGDVETAANLLVNGRMQLKAPTGSSGAIEMPDRLTVQAQDAFHQLRMRRARGGDASADITELREFGDIYLTPGYRGADSDLNKATRFASDGSVSTPGALTVGGTLTATRGQAVRGIPIWTTRVLTLSRTHPAWRYYRTDSAERVGLWLWEWTETFDFKVLSALTVVRGYRMQRSRNEAISDLVVDTSVLGVEQEVIASSTTNNDVAASIRPRANAVALRAVLGMRDFSGFFDDVFTDAWLGVTLMVQLERAV